MIFNMLRQKGRRQTDVNLVGGFAAHFEIVQLFQVVTLE